MEFSVIKLMLLSNFIINNFDFLDQIFPKRVFVVQNGEKKRHDRLQYIWISLGTKFHLKQTISDFWTKFTQKWYFWSKTG